MFFMYKDRPMEKFKRGMRHIKLISMNRRLFWIHLELHKAVQGAVHVHHAPLVNPCSSTGTWRSSRGAYGTLN
jgi:hypothetical protein